MTFDLQTIIPEEAELQNAPQPVRVIGIDLGTTNSTVAEIIWNHQSPATVTVRCLEIEQETQSGLYTHLLVPSAVALYQGKEWVGEGAKRLHTRAPDFGLELTRNIFLECKNDIGTRRTYHKAPEHFRTPAEISARLLRFMKLAAEQHDPTQVSRTVITVPASFQAAQRIDTVHAAEIADIPLTGGDLLDEPVAAFLDYILTSGDQVKGLLSEPQNVVVFDFGGGTCDVAVFRTGEGAGAQLSISPLAVSRYHRLGGGDIDRAILYEVLIPQLLKQNNIGSQSLTFDDNKNIIEPSFLGIAEALKIGLCNEINRLKSFNHYEDADKTAIVKKQPGQHTCKVGERVLQLTSPTLSAKAFEDLLEPFLDSDLLYSRETEYRLTCSIFAPIEDALCRCGLAADEIQLCLVVGGSSLIPQVQEAIDEYFENAKTLSFHDPDAVQTATARGAATHALALALYGKSIFQVVTNDSLSIKTGSGAYELVPKGTQLPYPSTGWKRSSDLAVPKAAFLESIPLLVEIIAGDDTDERPLLKAAWEIPGPVNKGEKLCLEYRLDENQVLELRLRLECRPDEDPFDCKLENPLSNVVNPNTTRLRINENEENLRTGKIPRSEIPDTVVEIARDYAELQQIDKAISYLKQALRMKNQPDPYVLNLLGIYYGEKGDHAGQEKFYREAAQHGLMEAALFNLALAQHRRKLFAEAKKTIAERNTFHSCGPSLTLAAQIEDSLDNEAARDSLVNEAISEFPPPRSASDWELGWLVTAARMNGDVDLMKKAQSELKRRKSKEPENGSVTGVLPEMTGGLTEVNI